MLEVMKGQSRSSSLFYRLPTHLLRSICHFLIPTRRAYIEDMGSVLGTYVRLEQNKAKADYAQNLDSYQIDENLTLVIMGQFLSLHQFE